jgi:predicted transcriptional regulator
MPVLRRILIVIAIILVPVVLGFAQQAQQPTPPQLDDSTIIANLTRQLFMLDQQMTHLRQQITQLMTENAELRKKCGAACEDKAPEKPPAKP